MGTLLDNRLTRPLFNPTMRALIGLGSARCLINALHNRLSFPTAERFFWSFGSAFRGVSLGDAPEVEWRAQVGDAIIRVPINREPPWVYWAIAVGLRGHDNIIKKTYETLLASPMRPEVFIDVGANYATHSLVMACHGLRTISFEPNPHCEQVAATLFAQNGRDLDLRPIAIGSEKREMVLAYPPGDTSLGVVSAESDEASGQELEWLSVRQERLDDQLIPEGSVLLKIDVEGHEYAVLEGASHLLRTRSPIVIFESNQGDTMRPSLYDLLTSLNFRLAQLPLCANAPPNYLSEAEFVENPDSNFVALPAGYIST